jgi:2-succinyl-5-enolpyruvyl-6-hydroxy-3-cyclohexene-1-carboxylate synthase
VTDGPDVNASFAATLVDEWVRGGVREAVVAPGSRSAPLALALARDERVRVHVVLDERSAAFLALGLAKASGLPAVVLCTSGTAAAGFHPAVLEAHHARVPLLVCTADRPPELRGTGAPQTIDQTELYGGAVRRFLDPGPPAAATAGTWRSLAADALDACLGAPRGPVHLNLAFREPLVPTGPVTPAAGRSDGLPWARADGATQALDDATLRELVDDAAARPRGLLVCGFGAAASPATVAAFAAATGWPVLADAVSGLRAGAGVVSTYEALLRAPGFAAAHAPELVWRVGGPLTSRVATEWLGPDVPQVLVDPDGIWLDPMRAATRRVVADPDALLDTAAKALDARGAGPGEWSRAWLDADRRARTAIDGVLDASDDPVEGRIARDVAASLPDGAALVVASSLPVRALEWCMHPRRGLRVLSNRGVNGIDGFVSTALGIARSGVARPTVALLGDLCFLHDTNGLLGAAQHGADLVLVVVDNGGGGIFDMLPQAALPELDRLFVTPHGVDVVEVARAHGVAARRVAQASEVLPAVTRAAAAGGVQAVVVDVDRATSTARHRAMWDAVARALDAPR